MGCCCSASTSRVSSIQGSARKFPDSDDFGGPVKERSCTDVIFLIFLSIYLIFLLAGITVACVRGDPRRLVYGVDDYGNLCGLQNKNISGAAKSGVDYRGVKYLKVSYTCTGGTCIKEKQCVKECPDGYEKTTMRRCMSSTLTQTTGSVIQSTLPYLQEVASDINLCWKEIVLLSLISIGLSVLLLIIFRYAATVIIWAILIVVTVAAIAVTIYVWVMWHKKKQALEGYEGPNRELRETQVRNWLIAAVIITILTVLYLLIVLFLRKKIKLVAALFEEAGKAIGFMPQILLQPVLTFISLVAICCFLLVGFICLQTSGMPLVDSSGKVTFPIDTFFQVMRWLSLFGFLWLTQFIFACQNLIVAGAISIWYFKRDKSKLSNCVCKSFRVLVLYHLGSAALGSLVIAIMKAIRALFRMLQKYMDSQNQRCDLFWKIFQCCLGCFESYLKFLSKNAYIMIAIYGDSFCASARRAFSTITSNAMKVAAVDGIGSFILFIGKVGVTVAVAFIALEVLKLDSTRQSDTIALLVEMVSDILLAIWLPALLYSLWYLGTVDGLHYIWIPVALVSIFAFLCSHCFLSIYEMTIETLLLCFCEDCQMNDGITRPYFMSKSLMSFVENSRKSARIKSVS